MAVDFKPHDSTGKLASRWLTKSGTLSKAEQLFLDAWMTRKSRDLRDTIGRECILLYEIGVFDEMPEMRIIPKIETIAEAGARKFLAWTDKAMDAIPEVVRTGFRALRDASKTEKIVAEADPFADVVAAEEDDDYSSGFKYDRDWLLQKDLMFKRAMKHSARLVMDTPDLKHPFFASFPSLEEATVFTFHHEAAHGAMLARQASNPIVAEVNKLAPYTDEEDFKADTTWERESWVALLSVQVPAGDLAVAPLDDFQTLWGEYYADVGAALMHARNGFNCDYLVPLCQARAKEARNHQTNPVLRELAQVLDFHPLVLKEKINAADLHQSIGRAIAPQIGLDVLTLMKSSAALSTLIERALPALPNTSQVASDGFVAMNEALGGQYPKAALFFAKLKNGPDVSMVSQAFEGRFEFKIGPQTADQMAIA